jgi:hypothetical protein
MQTIRLISVRLVDDAIEIESLSDDGQRVDFRLPMADFILLRLQLDQQANPPASQSSPLGPQQIQAIIPKQLTVLQESLSGDPVLKFGLGMLGDIAIQIPKTGLPAMLQQLVPYLKTAGDKPRGN